MKRYPQNARSVRCEYATARKWNARMAAGALMDISWDELTDDFGALTDAALAEAREWEARARSEWEETQRAHRTILDLLSKTTRR